MELLDGIYDYVIDAGVVKRCEPQVGCGQSDIDKPCVTLQNKSYLRCKKNKAGYSIRGGVVTRCAAGKTMAAEQNDADGCTTPCNDQSLCKPHKVDALCVDPSLLLHIQRAADARCGKAAPGNCYDYVGSCRLTGACAKWRLAKCTSKRCVCSGKCASGGKCQ